MFLSLPANVETTARGACTLTSDTTLFAVAPHMHQLGILVEWFDLHRGSDAWFLTMEHIDGVDLHARLSTSHDVRRTRQEAPGAHPRACRHPPARLCFVRLESRSRPS